MPKINKTILIFSSTCLMTGCSTINSTADYLGVNFWSHSPTKAPCKVASTANNDIPCIGIKIQNPEFQDRLRLRGSYSLDIANTEQHNVSFRKAQSSDGLVELTP